VKAWMLVLILNSREFEVVDRYFTQPGVCETVAAQWTRSSQGREAICIEIATDVLR
jgi:hypothetical protein